MWVSLEFAMLHMLTEHRLKVAVMLLHLKHATQVTGVAFGAVSPLLIHSWSFNLSKSLLKCVNHNRPVASTTQIVVDSTVCCAKIAQTMKHVQEISINARFSLWLGTSLLYDNTWGMPLASCKVAFTNDFSRHYGVMNSKALQTDLKGKYKLRQINQPAKKKWRMVGKEIGH